MTILAARAIADAHAHAFAIAIATATADACAIASAIANAPAYALRLPVKGEEDSHISRSSRNYHLTSPSSRRIVVSERGNEHESDDLSEVQAPAESVAYRPPEHVQPRLVDQLHPCGWCPMSGNLPDDVTDDDIDRAAGGYDDPPHDPDDDDCRCRDCFSELKRIADHIARRVLEED